MRSSRDNDGGDEKSKVKEADSFPTPETIVTGGSRHVRPLLPHPPSLMRHLGGSMRHGRKVKVLKPSGRWSHLLH